MSWLARSIAQSLRIDDEDNSDDDDDDHHHRQTTPPNPNYHHHHHQEPLQHQQEEDEGNGSENQGRGVKEDLSELRETLTRQIWGVASFLAPPPPPPPPPPLRFGRGDRSVSDRNRSESSGSGDVSDEDASDSVGDSGTRTDFADTGGGFRTEISHFSKFLPFGSEEDQIGDAVGVTEEALAFARNIAHHPETWLDFPLEEEDIDDFEMSDAQSKHALAVEHLARRLAALRIELCPAHMSEGYFWKVYFVLLHSRLNKHDGEVLSTPQIVAARALWIKELQKRTKPESDCFGRSTFHSKENDNSLLEDFNHTSPYDSPSGNMSYRTFAFEPTGCSGTTESETEKHPVESTEIQIDKSVIEEEPVIKMRDKEFVVGASYKVPVQDYDDDEDDWLKENSELEGYIGTTTFMGNEEDVSFSDLEDDDDVCTMPIKSKIVSKGWDKPSKTS